MSSLFRLVPPHVNELSFGARTFMLKVWLEGSSKHAKYEGDNKTFEKPCVGYYPRSINIEAFQIM